MSHNLTLVEQIFHSPLCEGWKPLMEGAMYHLANVLFLLGYMGGSGIFGSIYIFSLLALGFFCYALWGWLDACGLDVFAWSLLLVVFCLLQLAHLMYRLRKDTFQEEFDALYKTLYQPLQVPMPAFKEIVKCSEDRVLSLVKDQNYAVEGKTPIDRLSLLISGRVRVSLDGQFLHYVFPYQFLDSAEWESLRPSEEGIFQVTLMAETDCSYVSWPRKKLYLLLAKERYIARLFSVLLGFDISQKLYALNDKLFAKFGLRFDIRLPSLYHVLEPSPEAEKESGGSLEPSAPRLQPLATPIQKTAPPLPHAPLSSTHGRASWPDSDALASECLLRSYPRVLAKARAPLAPTQTPEL
ncbi:popeye domain-containing protein 2 isoform X2 [Rhinatrema bivittatum]|uniref:popeye domain-containing protein 2 isoform X2 n=1 Tax=Rhinatrema bivittatum TaxID=194408 RepID=UPI001129BD33|nr:popeye domain-containing protein 2 isoform X2 [Rhinatrema bivittatum]